MSAVVLELVVFARKKCEAGLWECRKVFTGFAAYLQSESNLSILFFHFLLHPGFTMLYKLHRIADFTMSEKALQLIAENKKRKATKLDLSDCDLNWQHLLKLSEFVWLKVLRLSKNNDFSNLSPLKNLQNSQRLYISDVRNLSDLSPLKGLHNLQRLDISHTGVSDLSPLKEIQNLQVLNISDVRNFCRK